MHGDALSQCTKQVRCCVETLTKTADAAAVITTGLWAWLAKHLRIAPNGPDRAHVAGVQRREGHATSRVAAPRCRKVLEEVQWAAPVARGLHTQV